MNNFDFENLYVNKEGELRLWMHIPFFNVIISFAIMLPLIIALVPLTAYRTLRDLLKQ